MWKAFILYIKSLGILGWILMGLSLFTALGAFEFYTNIPVLQKFPTWGWLLFMIIGLLLAPFFAFQKMRKQRDELKEVMEKHFKYNYAITWVPSLEEWYLREAHGRRNYWDNENEGIGLILRGDVSVTSIGTIQVESVSIYIGGIQFQTNWLSESFYTSEEREIEVDLPLKFQRGKRTAHLVAIVDGATYNSEPFILNIPEYKNIFQQGEVK